MLFQLPPHWRVNAERLAAFFALLPGDRHVAFASRDRSWQAQGRNVLVCFDNDQDGQAVPDAKPLRERVGA